MLKGSTYFRSRAVDDRALGHKSDATLRPHALVPASSATPPIPRLRALRRDGPLSWSRWSSTGLNFCWYLALLIRATEGFSRRRGGEGRAPRVVGAVQRVAFCRPDASPQGSRSASRCAPPFAQLPPREPLRLQ
ncbi:hypothetical protein EJB05_13525, partial [Eragrostis curvula]